MKFTLIPFNKNLIVPEIHGTISREQKNGLSSLRIDFPEIDSEVEWPSQVVRPIRRDNLWQATCFECFIGTNHTPYLEVNASPSGDWQAYYFTDYRADSKVSNEISVIAQSNQQQASKHAIALSVDITHPEFVTTDWQISVSVVLQIRNELGYFALHHPGAQPDFHLKELRCLDLPYPQ